MTFPGTISHNRGNQPKVKNIHRSGLHCFPEVQVLHHSGGKVDYCLQKLMTSCDTEMKIKVDNNLKSTSYAEK